MSEDGTAQKLTPASPDAVRLAASWAGRAYADEAEALLALELTLQAAIDLGRASVEAKAS
jgi:hypothetical protein